MNVDKICFDTYDPVESGAIIEKQHQVINCLKSFQLFSKYIFKLFKQTIQFLQQLNAKNII